MNTIQFKRTHKNQKNKLEIIEKQKEENETKGYKEDITRRYRYKRPTQVLKSMNISLQGKMEELRLIPLSSKEDNIGSFFFDELDFIHTSESSKRFYGLYLEIIDLSQTLPLVLVNKEKIGEELLSRIEDPYFKPIVGKLLVALIRDCGEEVFDFFTMKVMPRLASVLVVTDVDMVQIGFGVLAAGLKFMLKKCLQESEFFFKEFVKNFMPLSNHFLRRFSTECLVYLIKKTRNVKMLKKRVKYLMNLTPKDLDMDEESIHSLENMNDFFASLLFQTLKGSKGLVDEQAKHLVKIVKELMSKEKNDFVVKALNLLVEGEFRFYKERLEEESEQRKFVGFSYKIEEFLGDLVGIDDNGEILESNTVFKSRVIKILTDFLLFQNGSRFDKKLLKIAEGCLKGDEDQLQNIIFLAKFLIIKKKPILALKVLAEKFTLNIEKITTLFFHLSIKNSITREEVRESYHKEMKKLKESKLKIEENFDDSIPVEIFQFIILITMKFLEGNFKNLNEEKTVDIIAKFLNLFEKNMISQSLTLNQKIFKNIVDLLKTKSLNFWTRITFLRICRLSKNSENSPDLLNYLKKEGLDFRGYEVSEDLNKESRVEDGFYNENGLLEKEKMITKNGTLRENLDSDTLLFTETVKILLKRFKNLDPDTLEKIKNSLRKFTKKFNLEATLLKTIFKFIRYLKITNTPLKDFTKLNNKEKKVHSILPKWLKSILIKSLESRSPHIREESLKILQMFIKDSSTKILITKLQSINLLKVDFYTERDIIMNIYHIEKFDFSKIDMKILLHFMIGYSSVRIANVHDAIKNLFVNLSQRVNLGLEKLNLFKIYEEVLLKSLVIRNYFDWKIDIETENIVNHGILLNKTEGIFEDDTGKLNSKEIFIECYRKDYDAVDNCTHLERLFELIPSVLGYKKKKLKGNKEKNGEEEGNENEENAMVIEDEGQNMEEEDDESKNKTKQEDVEDMQNFNEKIFKFFKAFLVQEIQFEVVPSLQPVLKENPVRNLSEKTGENGEELNYFEEVLNLLDKSKSSSEPRLRRSSSIWRMFKFTEILLSMKKIPSSNFSSELYNILLEILKFPDSCNQRNVLACIRKVKDQDKIIAQFYPILRQIIEKEQFKGILLTFNKQISDFGELERASIMPIATSILYRKLIDKRGTGNHKNLNSIRDFVLDTISNFRKEEIQSLLKTLFISFYCDIDDKNSINVREILLKNKFNRLTGVVETIKNIIKKLGPLVLENLEFIQEFLLQNLKLCQDIKEYFYEEFSKIKNVKLFQEVEFSLREKLIKSLMRSVKGLKQTTVGRIKDLYAHFIEIDFEYFTDKICEINQDFIENFGIRAYQKPPQIFKIFGCWSECEMYKIYFFKYPKIFQNIIKLLESEKINLSIFDYITDMMVKIVEYNISDNNQTKYDLENRIKKYLSKGQKVTTEITNSQSQEICSTLGLNIIKNHIPEILTSLGIFVNRMFERGKELKNLTRSDRKKINLKMTEFCMFISVFIDKGEETVQKFVNIIEKFWDVNKFNKVSDKPEYMIKTAEKLLLFENEITFQANMLGLMSNLAPKIIDIEAFYRNNFLPFLSKLGKNSLRGILRDVLLGIVQNKNFENLNLNKNLCLEIADMLELVKNLAGEKFDFEKITKFLIKITQNFEEINNEGKFLIAVNCVAWAKSEELSVRFKALDYLKMFNSVIKTKSAVKDYKELILDTAIYYLKSHYGDEDRIKSTMEILKENIDLAKRTEILGYNLPYKDLEGLEIPEQDSKSKKKEDFFTKVLNLKLVKRARAFRSIIKKIDEENKKFEPRTVREVFIPLIEYFTFELWRDTKNPSRGYSKERKDRVLTILHEAYNLYGKVAGMLTFPQFVNHLKATINYIGMSYKPQETVIKLICSCLDNINQNVVDVLKVVKKEYKEKNSEYLRESFINQILKTYENKREFDKARIEGEDDDEEGEEEEDIEDDEVDFMREGMVEEDISIGVDKLSEYQLKVLRVKVLKPLKSHLKKKSNYYGKVSKADKLELNPEVALAIVKLIRIFPIDVFNSELISAIGNIAKCLRSKIEKIRQTARETLCEISIELGPFFLGFIIRELSSHLTKGFEVHVRNYTIFKILDGLIGLHNTSKNEDEELAIEEDETPKISYGEIDYCVKDISEMILDEVAGGLAQEKEAKEVRTRIREYAKNKGYSCFRMIASKIDFKSNANLFSKSELGSSIKKFDELMDNLVLGLHRNTTITREALFLWTITVNKRAIKAITKQATEAESDIVPDKKMTPDELKRHNKEKTFKIQDGAAQGASIFSKRDIKSLPFGRLVANFALKLFHRKLRSDLFSQDFEKNEEYREQIREYMSPFIDQLITFMNSDISKLMQGSLLIIAHIINWPVFSLENKGRKLLRIILRIFSKMGSTDLNLLQCCFKMIKRIILTNRDFLPNSQITEIYILLEENLYPADWVTEPLHCLSAMITQKLFKDRLYDILDKVFAGVIKTRNDSIRSLSKGVLLNFVENAPMSKNLLEKFILKLVNNINFDETEGREVVIEILYKFVLKFPVNLYQEHINVMVLTLVTGIVNEINFPLKQKMKTLAAQIILNCQYAEFNKETQNFIDYCTTFLQNEDYETKRAGIVILDSLFSAGISDNRVKSKMADVIHILKGVSEQIGEFYMGINDEKELKLTMKNSPWKNILIRDNAKEFLIKIKNSKEVTVDCLFVISTFINSGFLKLEEIEELTKIILELKNHPDEDIKLFVYDMMSHLLSLEPLNDIMKSSLKDLLMMIFSALKNPFFKSNAFLVKSGIFVHKIYKIFGGEIKAIRGNFLSALDKVSSKSLKFYKKGKPVYKKIFGLLDLILQQYYEEKEEDNNGEEFKIENEELEQLLKIIMRFSLNGNITKEEELTDKIEEISENLKNICDSSDEYMQLYSKLKKDVLEGKIEFKEKIKQLAINNPEEYAKLKIKKGLTKRAKAKDRIQDMKNGLYIPKKKMKKSF